MDGLHLIDELNDSKQADVQARAIIQLANIWMMESKDYDNVSDGKFLNINLFLA